MSFPRRRESIFQRLRDFAITSWPVAMDSRLRGNDMKIVVLLLFLFFPFSSHASGYVLEKKTVASGTGFFVNMLGNIVTNEHVVRNCKNITVKGSVDITPATLIAVDSASDLALLKVNIRPNGYAKLRLDYALQPEERVMVIGYPKEHSISGEYLIRMASIIDNKGPSGEKEWIQFTDSAEQGNSGGPLVDKKGNVIGVVRARVQFYRLNRVAGQAPPANEDIIKNGVLFKSSNIAITTNVLQDFLNRAAAPYDSILNLAEESDYSLEENASKYIVNVHCYLN